MTDKTRPVFQVQPRFDFRDEWEDLAQRENLSYEAMDFSTQPALLESGLFEEYSEWYLSCGRTCSIHGFFIDINPASGDPDIRGLSRSRCDMSCRTALAVGAQNVVFHSSCFPFLRGVYLDVWSKRCADLYEELADKYDLNIFIENSQDIDAVPIKTLMNCISDKRIGVCLDIGHANYSNISISQWFEELGEWIGYIHLSDNSGQYDDHLPLGTGSIDWDEADRLWKGLGRNTFFTIETSGISTTTETVRFLKEHDYFGINRISK